jgi:hypothetical protein
MDEFIFFGFGLAGTKEAWVGGGAGWGMALFAKVEFLPWTDVHDE